MAKRRIKTIIHQLLNSPARVIPVQEFQTCERCQWRAVFLRVESFDENLFDGHRREGIPRDD